jgi:hypothetical protein
MESESAARAAVLQRFPSASFGRKVSTLHEPTAMAVGGVDEVLYAWEGPPAPGANPVADILFPSP